MSIRCRSVLGCFLLFIAVSIQAKEIVFFGGGGNSYYDEMSARYPNQPELPPKKYRLSINHCSK